jgi:uncharacterized protein YbaP (TraB family)
VKIVRVNARRVLPAFLAALLLASLSGTVGEGARNVFLWKVESRSGSSIHLLGSIHLLKRGMYPLDRRIETAFEKSESVAVETDLEGAGKKALNEAILNGVLYANGDRLRNHVSPETYGLAERYFGAGEMDRIEMFKPWALAMTVTVLECRKMGYEVEAGVDRYFLGKARGRKKIRELEPPDRVMGLLDGLPGEVQDRYLRHTLADLDKSKEEMSGIVEAWSGGDPRAMEAIVARSLREHPDLAPVFDAVLYRRNRDMVRAVEDYLKRGERCFVVVGAAHLVGKDGILDLLARKGYRVEQQ